jgi:hypothetical protein
MTDFKVIDSPLVLQKKIKQAISAKYEQSEFKKKTQSLSEELAKFFYIKFLESDTFLSLTQGDLRGEFGLSDRYLYDIEEVCRQIAAIYISVEHDISKKFIKITIGASDNEDIDLSEIGVYSTEKGQQIHWLYWLLTQGTNVVVPDYNVKFIQGAGRSHMAIMVQDDYVSYTIDEQYAGTAKDNWITRTLNQNKNEFLNIIKRYINGT